MSKKTVYAGSCIALLAFSGFNLFFSSGIVGVTQKPNHIFFKPGCICHGDSSSPNVTAWIEGPESLNTGEEAVYWIRVRKDSNVAAGFNVASFFGSLGIVDTEATQLIAPSPSDSAEMTHIMPREANGNDTISWPFLYRAPGASGVIDTLYANSNSVNLSGDPKGDEWAFAPNFLIQVVSSNSVEDEQVPLAFSLSQNYPNPFNPTTSIHFRIQDFEGTSTSPKSRSSMYVSVKVYDLTGREVATLVNEHLSPGAYKADFNASGLTSGIYFYTLQAGRFTQTRKMLLLK